MLRSLWIGRVGFGEQVRQAEGGARIALAGGLLEPAPGLRGIAWSVHPVEIEHRQQILRLGVAGAGQLLQRRRGLGELLEADGGLHALERIGWP